MLGRNVGNEKRCANGKPADVAPAEEVVGGSAPPAGEVEANRKDYEKVKNNDGYVNCREVRGGQAHIPPSTANFSVRVRADLRTCESPCLAGKSDSADCISLQTPRQC